MPPATRDNKLEMLSAEIIGIVRGFLSKAKLRFTGEKFASASEGLPTVNLHQGTKKEIKINSSEAIPAVTQIQLVLVAIGAHVSSYWDITD